MSWRPPVFWGLLHSKFTDVSLTLEIKLRGADGGPEKRKRNRPSPQALRPCWTPSEFLLFSLLKEGPLGNASKRQRELTKRKLQKNNAREVVRVDVILLPVQINMPLGDTKPLHSERARSPACSQLAGRQHMLSGLHLTFWKPAPQMGFQFPGLWGTGKLVSFWRRVPIAPWNTLPIAN